MTTPKAPTLAMWTAIDSDAKQPFRELAEEFRRLAAESLEASDLWRSPDYYSGLDDGWVSAWERAAQMLEEKLT